MKKHKLLRMDNVLIVVEDLEAVKTFFLNLGFEQEGETNVEGPNVDLLIGLKDVRATLVFLKTPDGQRVELDKFHSPDAVGNPKAQIPVNKFGIRRIMLAVEGLEELLKHLLNNGVELVGEMVNYGNTYKLVYVRGPEGIIVGLAEQLG